jgi:zinc transporter ZupT
MQKYKHIKAIFFLGIFSLLLLHQIVPHLHHQHEVKHSHRAVSHSDNHTHHHETPLKDSSKKGLLSLFLEAHVHSLVSNEIIVTHESSVKQFKVNKEIKALISANHYSITIIYDKAEKPTVYQPPNIYFDSYLSSLDSRGPPILG